MDNVIYYKKTKTKNLTNKKMIQTNLQISPETRNPVNLFVDMHVLDRKEFDAGTT